MASSPGLNREQWKKCANFMSVMHAGSDLRPGFNPDWKNVHQGCGVLIFCGTPTLKN